MKKIIAMLLVLSMVLAFAGCAKTEEAPEPTAAPVETTTAAVETEATETEAAETEAAAAVMTHEEYMAAELDSAVTIETYVQGHQSWWDNKVTVYCQSPDGAYFLYELSCSEEDAAKLTPGTKIRVTGFKGEWAGEVEIMEGTFEILEEDTYVAAPLDVTALLGTDEMVDHQNEVVSFKGMTIEASKDADGKEVPFLYNYDGSGTEGDDLYFNASRDGKTYTFTIESYLTDKDSDVYKAVKNLKIGDTVDMEGFLYWYEGANPHITSIKAASSDSSAAETVESAASSAASSLS